MNMIQHADATGVSETTESQDAGHMIRVMREAMGLSRAELGRLSHWFPCSASTVGRVERGEVSDPWRGRELAGMMGRHLADLHNAKAVAS